MSRVVVVTVVAGRHDHLRHQHRALARCRPAPDHVVVVTMGDPGVAAVVAGSPMRSAATVVETEVTGAGLPLARARNRGFATAAARGADVVVLLDVDCLPTPHLLERYRRAAAGPAAGDLLSGPVAYLPRLPPGEVYGEQHLRLARPHPARPDPPDGTVVRGGDHRLFWSLSFAVRPAVWDRIGGFDEAYVGYGGEDTDLGQRAMQAGVGLAWVGGATAHHQWHPVSDPPVEHVADVVRNANLFRERWGWTPMEGWLAEFARQGLVGDGPQGWFLLPRGVGSQDAAGRHRDVR